MWGCRGELGLSSHSILGGGYGGDESFSGEERRRGPGSPGAVPQTWEAVCPPRL